MLVGMGPIHKTFHENASTGEDIVDGMAAEQVATGGTKGDSSSAIFWGMEAENRRLRDQLGSVQKRLGEKDSIISQLMKRIGDLESKHTGSIGGGVGGQQQHVGTTPSFASHQPLQHNNLTATPLSLSTSFHSA